MQLREILAEFSGTVPRQWHSWLC